MMAAMLPLAISASWVASSVVVPPTENSFCRSFQVLTPSTNFGSVRLPVHFSPSFLAMTPLTPNGPAPKETAEYQFWPGMYSAEKPGTAALAALTLVRAAFSSSTVVGAAVTPAASNRSLR